MVRVIESVGSVLMTWGFPLLVGVLCMAVVWIVGRICTWWTEVDAMEKIETARRARHLKLLRAIDHYERLKRSAR